MNNQKRMISIVAQTGMPVLLCSDPGAGKTQYIKAIAEATGRNLVDLYPAGEDRISIAGGRVPLNDEGGRRMAWFAPEWLDEACQPGTMLVAEELGSTPDSIKVPLMQLFGSREMGPGSQKRVLQEDTIIMATMNPRGTATAASGMSAAMANRFAWIDWEVDVAEWCHGVVYGFDESKNIAVLPDNWKDHLPAGRAVIAAYMEKRGKKALHNVPESRADKAGPWASPRTWSEGVARIIAAYRSLDLHRESELQAAIATVIGEKAATDLFIVLDTLDLPSRDDVIAGIKAGLMDAPKRADKVAVLAAMAGSIMADSMTKKPSEELWRTGLTFMISMATEHGNADVWTKHVTNLCQRRSGRWKAPAGLEIFGDVAAAVSEVV